MDFKELDEKLKKYNKIKLNSTFLKQLREDLIIKWTYNSNAIEGNTFNLIETKVLLEDGITIGGKSLKEHLEIIGHAEAIYYVEELIINKANLTEKEIKIIHSLVTKGIENVKSGQYRDIPVFIQGAKHIPPQPFLVSPQMESLLKWYSEEKDMHPIEKASILHGEFVKIHPFIDGNGRTARLLLNFELMKNEYPPIIIEKEDRYKYYESLEKGSISGKWKEFIEFVRNKCEERIDFINSFKKEMLKKESYIPKKIKNNSENER